MTRHLPSILISSCALAVALQAQSPPATQAPPASQPPARITVASQLASQYSQAKRALTAAAAAMPEDSYAYRPVPEVRTFAAAVAHVAVSNYGYCANLTGTPAPVDVKGPEASKAFTDAIVTKAQATKALADSFAYCDGFVSALKPENMTDTYTATSRGPDGTTRPIPVERAGLLAGLTAHNNEMYGYLAVYLRLKGIVPPTSQPAGRGRGGAR